MQPHKRNPRNKSTMEDLQNNDRSGQFEHDFMDDEMREDHPQDLSNFSAGSSENEIEDSNSNRQDNMNKPAGKRGRASGESNKPGMGGARQNEGGRHSRTNQATGTRRGN